MFMRKMGGIPVQTKYDIQKTRPMSDYFEGKAPMQSDKLKIRLINEGYLDEECTICTRSQWYGDPIPLQLDHINGDNDDNRLENLRLLCPNCHAQTPQYRLKDEFKDSIHSNENKESPNTDQ